MRYKKLYPAVICFCVFLAAIGLVLGDPSTVLPGLWKIIVTEDALITDYVKIAGVSAALVNSALVTLVSLLLLYLSKEPPNGFTLVELGLMAGFSLFGKNIVNIWPIIAGTFLYAKARREPFGKYVSVSLLATALAPVLINMGVNGLIGMAFILATGGDLNGPTLGGILTIMGFSAFGKHARNITPIMLGVVIGGVFMHFDINQSSVQLALLFGTTLAPISGYFGWPFGIVAGFLHSSVVLHAGTPVEGINLYNNGFSGGLLAIVLYPIISEAIRHHRPGLQDRDYFDDTIEHDEPLVPPPARRK